MNKLKFALPLLALCVALGGCPYESKVPLDSAVVKINPALIGTWQSTDSASSDQYIVSKLDDSHYKIEQKEKDLTADGLFKGTYNGYLSNVDGEMFMNLSSTDSLEAGNFFFYKIALNKAGSKLVIASVTENIDEKFTKPEELKAFFQKNKGLSFFYEKEEQLLVKKK
jgi:hypothetical protein